MVEEIRIKRKEIISEEELKKVRRLCKEIRELTLKSIEQLIPRYVKLGEWVKRQVDRGISIRSLARLLKEPGFGKDSLNYARRLSNALDTFYRGDISKMIQDLKARLGEPLTWRRIINDFLIKKHKPKKTITTKPKMLKGEEIRPTTVKSRKMRDNVTQGEGVFLENKPDSGRSVTPVTSETSTYTDILAITDSEDPRLLIYGEIVARYRGLIQNLRTFLLDSIKRYVSKQNLPLIMDELDWKLKEALDKVNEYAKEIIDLYIKPPQMS